MVYVYDTGNHHIAITRRCGSRCVFCFNRSQTLPEHLPTLDLTAIPSGKRMITLTGGEPLLHPNIQAFVATIQTGGYRCNVYTNGLHPERLPLIAGADQIEMSFHTSDAATHHSLTGVHAFDAVLRSLDWLSSEFTGTVFLHTVVCNLNLHTLESTLQFLAGCHPRFTTRASPAFPIPTPPSYRLSTTQVALTREIINRYPNAVDISVGHPGL